MTRQTLFNLAALALLALLVLNTVSIARSLRRIERKGRHPMPVWFVMKAPTLSMKGALASFGGVKTLAVCNALKLSHFTAVKLSHPGQILSSVLF